MFREIERFMLIRLFDRLVKGHGRENGEKEYMGDL